MRQPFSKQTMRQLILLFLFLFSISSSAQLRKMNYYAKDGAIVCDNGNNKYTRALYGTFTDFRLETSDRPIFAIFSKKVKRNIRFYLVENGNEIPLDSLSCRSSWYNKLRTYSLGKAPDFNEMYLLVSSLPGEEAYYFTIEPGRKRNAKLKVVVSETKSEKLFRNGDIGVCSRDAFDPGKVDTTYLYDLNQKHLFLSLNGAGKFSKLEDFSKLYMSLNSSPFAGNIYISTPDSIINTLGGSLQSASNGIWDKVTHTWVHGSVGWRTPLAGWRGAYVGDVLGMWERQNSHFANYAKSMVTEIPVKYPLLMQDSAHNLSRGLMKWGTPIYSNGYICKSPGKADQMSHYDMDLVYLDELLWHIQYGVSNSQLREYWKVIKDILAWEKRNFDPDGDHLYDAYACIWASDALYYNAGAVTHSSAYNYRANLLAAKIARKLGVDGKPYQDEADAILKAMKEKLWISTKGHWAEYKDAMGLKRVHEDAALWSIYTPIDCGVGSRELWDSCVDYVEREIPHIPVQVGNKTIGNVLATSSWQPYEWSINNVAPAECYHMALAEFQAGRKDEAFNLLKSVVVDNMFYGQSPGNFGQLSYYDAARGECYRDFADVIGIASRAIVQGLFGIVPDALEGKCYIRPAFPESWDKAEIKLPYLSYKYRKVNGKAEVYDIMTNFPQHMDVIVELPIASAKSELKDVNSSSTSSMGLDSIAFPVQGVKVALDKYYNAKVNDIYKNKYLSPRPSVTTLEIPTQGIGDWCSTKKPADIMSEDPIVYTSLWDNYPDSIIVKLKGKANRAILKMAGSTNHMQSKIDNGIVVATYSDNTTDTLHLVNPYNWCPIEQDYYEDGKAFTTSGCKPYREDFATHTISRNLADALGIDKKVNRTIPGGACQYLSMPLNPKKKLKSITLRTLSNDVVIGLMDIYLQ